MGHAARQLPPRDQWEDPTFEPLVDASDVSPLFGVGNRTITRWAQKGKLPHYKMEGSRLIRFRLSEIENYLARMRRSEIQEIRT